MAIFLCGFMGCGKSTVSVTLAKQLGCACCDMDSMIVKKEGMTIPEIFDKKGEQYFRQAESRLVEELADYKGVVSCGGGTMLSDANAEIARKNGTVIFINVPFEVCYERISRDTNRPLIISKTKEEVKELFGQRYEKYKKNSDYTVSGDGAPLETARLIIQTAALK